MQTGSKPMGVGLVRHWSADSLEMRAIEEARLNSELLFDDARLMFEHGRWSTSISLSILACEEAAKFLLFNYAIMEPSYSLEEFRRHKEKQAQFSRHLKTCLKLLVFDEYMLDRGEVDPAKRLLRGVLFFDECFTFMAKCGDLVEAEKAIAQNAELGPTWLEIQRRLSSNAAYAVAEQAAQGCLDEIKQKGFYVDVNDGVISAPRNFDEADAALYLRAAEIVIDSISRKRKSQDDPIFASKIFARPVLEPSDT